MTEHYQIYGGPASPYSLKLRAVFRYRRIPHTWLVPQGGFTGEGTLGGDNADSPLAQAQKGVVPVVRYPDDSWKADSTPIMYDLEARYAARSLIPPHPGIAFVSHLIEDMADEYLPLPMFYFRWTTDAEWCGRRQMIGWNGAMDDEQLAAVATRFAERQRGQLGPRAQIPPEQMQANYETVLDALETQLTQSLFLFGNRPSFAEFGLFGQLTQYAVDPFVSNLMKSRAVRVFQWTQLMDDLSGVEGEWSEPADCLTESLVGILTSMAPGYFFMMEMMKQVVGDEDVTSALNGPKYRVKSLLALKQELAALEPADRELIKPVLQAAEAWEALQFAPGEAERASALLPG